MQSKRTTALMAVLLALVLAWVAKPVWDRLAVPERQAPLPGASSVADLRVVNEGGKWFAAFSYYYTGEPVGAAVLVRLSAPASASNQDMTSYHGIAQRGTHQAKVEIERPNVADALTTTLVGVRIGAMGGAADVASQQIAQRIDWPDFQSWSFEREVAGKTPQQRLDKAIALIDQGDRGALADARRLLERLVAEDPRLDAAYLELARIAMKTNWGPEGLHQAEQLIGTSLQVKADNPNAKILLGYVQAHQGRHRQAEALFVDVARAPNDNLWLWTDWGELLAMQGKTEGAIQKFREALARPRSDDRQDRARLDAYRRLLALLEQRKDVAGLDALYKRRAEEYGHAGCYGAEYARFKLLTQGDAEQAITLARAVVNDRCHGDLAREILAMSHYKLWAAAPGDQRNDALHQARALMPSGPRLMYRLAASEHTLPAARRLLAAGERVDQRDNQQLTALAHALQEGDHTAARRLLQLGARPTTVVGGGDMPVALLPVMTRDASGIRLMQQFGVDYSALRYQGMTALDHAKQTGDRVLLDLLDRRSSGA